MERRNRIAAFVNREYPDLPEVDRTDKIGLIEGLLHVSKVRKQS
jgi:hypothetical protein